MEKGNYKDEIKAIKDGDLSSFEWLYHHYYSSIFHFVEGFLRSKEDAEEITQDTFLKLWNYRAKLDETLPVNRLIFRMAKHLVIDKLRKRENQNSYIDIAEHILFSNNSEEELLFKELKLELDKIIDKLPEKRKQIFLMSRQQQLTYREIAEKLNISTKTVEAQMNAALNSLRKEFGEKMLLYLLLIYPFL